MAETLTATSPLQGWSEKFAHLAPTVTLREEPFVAMVDLWADPDGSAASQASAILGSGPADHAVDVCQQRHTDRHMDGARRSG